MYRFSVEDINTYPQILEHIKANWKQIKARNGKIIGWTFGSFTYKKNTREYITWKAKKNQTWDYGDTVLSKEHKGKLFLSKHKDYSGETHLSPCCFHTEGEVWDALKAQVKKEMLTKELSETLVIRKPTALMIKI